MASTSANSDSVLIEKPRNGNTMNTPTQRHRHGQERDERRAPALQEDEHDEHDQPDGLGERDEDLLDAGLHGRRRVERDLVVHAGREVLLQLLHRRAHRRGDVERVRAGELEGRDDAGGLAVERALLRVVERAHLDARDVAHAHERAVGVGAHDDVAELLGRDEAALRAHGVGELLPGRRRLGAHLAGGVDDVLRAHGVLDVGDREAQARRARRA